MKNIREAFELYVEDVIESGDSLPEVALIAWSSGETKYIDYPALGIAV